MDFRRRKKLLDPIKYYLKSDNCSLENLLGLKATLLSLEIAIEKRIKKMVKDKDRLNKLIKTNKEEEYLD